jgi:hypothetical protein
LTTRIRHLSALALLACGALGCPHSRGGQPLASSAGALPATRPIAESVYDGALKAGWEDSGWSPHDIGHGPASIDFSKRGGWMITKPTLKGRFGGLTLHVKAPVGEAEFLEVRLDSRDKKIFPRVMVRADQKADLGDGWEEVYIPISELDPDGSPFDRIVLRAFRDMPSDRVLIDKIALVEAGADGGAPPPSIVPAASATLRVECRSRGKAISPLIYGIAWDAMAKAPPTVHATSRRWGGNPTSRYNWQLGNAWNTGSDWFFENVEIKPVSKFFDENTSMGMSSALTVPILGWVAKDTTSSSFPVSAFGPQQRADDFRKDAGNGNKTDGKPIPPGPPERTSLKIDPSFDGRWLEALKKDGRKVDIVILDNEPGLWNETHRDVHPDPTTYDELLEKTVQYATAVRKAAPDVKIAGPAEWGWTGYLYSAKDKKAGFHMKPDRRAHGDEPMIPWLLKRVKAEADKTNTKLLDLLDLHFYPQGQNVYSAVADPKTAALRINMTRGLWDRSYTDESWINEPIYLLPRMRQWIDESYPGLGIMIGEWSFGGESHMSGGLADAEALGRFGEYGVTAAYYWTVPPAGSPAAAAFDAYRNFDGKGGHFEGFTVPTKASLQTSLFASRDRDGKHLVLVALNFSPDAAIAADVDVGTCGETDKAAAYTYTGQGGSFMNEAATAAAGKVKLTLPAYSITVIDLHLAAPIGVAVE